MTATRSNAFPPPSSAFTATEEASVRALVSGYGIWTYAKGINYSRLPKTLAKLNKVRAGAANMTADFIGDSTTGDADGVRTKSWSHSFAKALSARDSRIKTSTDAWAGQMAQTTISGLQALDPRWGTIGAGWSITAQFSYGGNILSCSNSSTATATFNPEAAWNTVEIEWLANPSQGTFTLAAGASVFATIDGTQNPYVANKATYTTGSGAAVQALNIARASGGGIYILSIRCYDSATKAVLVCNAGSHSSGTPSWATNGGLDFYGVLSRITKRAADLCVIALGVNDWNTALPLATHISNLTTIVQTAQAAGSEVILIGQPESDPTAFASASTQDSFREAQFALADTLNCAALNIKTKMGGYATANALGYMADQRHPNNTGGWLWGDALAMTLLAA